MDTQISCRSKWEVKDFSDNLLHVTQKDEALLAKYKKVLNVFVFFSRERMYQCKRSKQDT